jgi:hypothetical protein
VGKDATSSFWLALRNEARKQLRDRCVNAARLRGEAARWVRRWGALVTGARVRGGVHGGVWSPPWPDERGLGIASLALCGGRRACSSMRTWAVTSGKHAPALDASSFLGLSSLVQTDQHKIHGDEAYGSHVPVVNISSMHKKHRSNSIPWI